MTSNPRYRSISLANATYDALQLSIINAAAAAGHRVTVSERVLSALRCEDAARRILEIHWSRAGYCNECGGGWPCATVRALTEQETQ